MDTEDFIKHESSMEQVVQTEGILFKGFGIIPKFPMLDRDLDISAKGIYAYFCSLAGNGTTSFPSVKTILKHLSINESTYYKFYKQLIDNGYISANQERKIGGAFSKNIITLINNPKKFESTQIQNSGSASQVRFKGLKSFGYGIIPRYIMFNERLDIKAKAIYAYFCSFSGSNEFSFPERKNILYHLGLAKNTYYKHYNTLLKLEYIIICQRRVKNGKLSVNDYILNEFPNDNATQEARCDSSKEIESIENADISPCLNFSGTVESTENTDVSPCLNLPCTVEPCTNKPCPNIPCTIEPCTINSGTNINNETINNININSNASNNDNKNKETTNSRNKNHSLSLSKAVQSERVNDSIVDFENLTFEEQQQFINQITDELHIERGLPYSYKADPIKMEIAIKYVVGYKENYFTQSQQQDTFDLFVKALIDLCTFDGNRKLKGSFVTYSHIIKELNKIIQSSTNEFDIHYSLENFARSVMATFNTVLENTVIKNYVAYIQSCIWDAFSTYKVKEINLLKTDEYINLKDE